MFELPVDPHLYLTFLGVMAVMAVTPGPANLFAVAAGMERGRTSALISVVGMNAATLVWFGAAALGLGALVKAFPAAFRLIAIAGALYVAWLGARSLYEALRKAPPAAAPSPASQPRKSGAFMDGFAVQIANPKAILFFTAVLPPFLDVARPVAPQLALFAAAVIGMDMITMSAYALSGAALSNRMQRPGFRKAFGVFVGCLLLTASALIIGRT